MKTFETATIVKVGSTTLRDPESYEKVLIDEPGFTAFTNIATQLKDVDQGLLVSSGAYLAGKSLDPQSQDTGYLTARGWQQTIRDWNEAFGEDLPAMLAQEHHFQDLDWWQKFVNAISRKTVFEPNIERVLETIAGTWSAGKILLANQNDPVSKIGLAPKVLRQKNGHPEFHGDNDLFAAAIAISVLEHGVSQQVNMILLSGKDQGILDTSGVTIPTVSVNDIKAMIKEARLKGKASREGANGFTTKGEALLRAHEAGVNVALGSALSSNTAILEAADQVRTSTITRISANLSQI